MTTPVLPKNLNYNLLKPVGYPSKVVSYKFTPMTQIGQNTNDIIRFNISTNGFWDPYSAYIELDVDCSDMDFGTLQVDNSAHSFINELLITQSGTEIERIQEYDVLAAMLNDMHYNIGQRSNKKHEGFGYVDCGNIRGDVFGRQLFTQRVPPPSYNSVVPYGTYNTYVGFKPLFDCSNEYTAQLKGYTGDTISTAYFTYNDAGTSTAGLGSYAQKLMGETIQRFDLTYQQINNTSYIDDQSINFRRQNKADLGTGTVDGTDKISIDNSWQNKSPAFGYGVPFSRSMSGTCFEPSFSTTFNQASIVKGYLDQNQKISKGRFCIPIMSGLIGVLMPKESYKYIPMSVLNELQLEFRLNPFAMFTSGYLDDPKILTITNGNTLTGTCTDSYSTDLSNVNQQRRRWKITKFDIHVEIHHFEPAIENQILSNIQTEDGIILHTNSWMFGPYYQFSALQQPSGNYQINLGFESLKNIMFCFIPNDWLSYTFCRKQFRINHNITSIQYKLGQQFFPSEKLSGHSGLPRGIGSFDNTNDTNNSVFLMELYKAFGKLNNVDEDCFVNCDNFAINNRSYNPTTKSELMTRSGTALNAYIYTWTNMDTSAGLPLFHENRCVGKAIYAMNFETLNTDNSVISGINTIGLKPFDIIIQSDSLQFTGGNGEGTIDPRFARSSTMYTFCHYDMLIKISKTGTVVIGRG